MWSLTHPVALPWRPPTEGELTASLGSTQPEAGSQRREESRVLAHLTVSTVSNWPQPCGTTQQACSFCLYSPRGRVAEVMRQRNVVMRSLRPYLVEERPDDDAGEVDVTLHRHRAALQTFLFNTLTLKRSRARDTQTCRQV